MKHHRYNLHTKDYKYDVIVAQTVDGASNAKVG